MQKGALPPGLDMQQDGTLLGTPTLAGAFEFTVQSTESGTFHSNDGHASYSITILPKLVPESVVPVAEVGQSYSHKVAVAGGVPPYSIDVKGLPAHFTYDAQSATITGDPTFSGTYTLELDVSDSGDPRQSAAVTATLLVKPVKVSITTSSLPNAQLDVPYSATLTTQDGSGNFQWSISDGLLPDGVHIDPSSGTISGTPSKSGTFTFTVEVADLDSPPDTASQVFNLMVQ